MLTRATNVIDYNTSVPATDLAGVAEWARDSVKFVVDRNIMTVTDHDFESESTYTKAQAITTMVRFYENLR